MDITHNLYIERLKRIWCAKASNKSIITNERECSFVAIFVRYYIITLPISHKVPLINLLAILVVQASELTNCVPLDNHFLPNVTPLMENIETLDFGALILGAFSSKPWS